MHEVVISIIIPTYNAAERIPKLLDDVLSQTYKNYEIIVLDDGSTDNTQEIISQYLLNDKIQYIKTENQGVSMARNLGMKMALGKYLRFLDADDRIPPNSLELLINAMESAPDVDMVIGAYEDNSEKSFYCGENSGLGKVDAVQMASNFVRYVRSFYYGVVWNKLYKKSIIENNKIYFNKEFTWCEDFLFNLEYYQYCNYFYFLPSNMAVYCYIANEDSVTHIMNKEKSNSYYDMIETIRKEKAYKFFEKFGLEECFELEWKYKYLYYRITGTGKPNREKNILKRYKEFKDILNDEGVKKYIRYQASIENNTLRIWIILNKVIDRKRYILFYAYLSVRGYMSMYCKFLFPLWRKISKRIKPKGL